MRKKKVIKKRSIKPDKKFASTIVSQLINKVMKNGEKRTAMNIVYRAAQIIEENQPDAFLTMLEKAIENVKPSLEAKSRKLGSSNRRIPVKVEERRALTLALRWLVEGAREKSTTKPMFEKLAEEIKDAQNKTGGAFKKKETVHKEAMGNIDLATAASLRS